jgi:hypothetical protein
MIEKRYPFLWTVYIKGDSENKSLLDDHIKNIRILVNQKLGKMSEKQGAKFTSPLFSQEAIIFSNDKLTLTVTINVSNAEMYNKYQKLHSIEEFKKVVNSIEQEMRKLN